MYVLSMCCNSAFRVEEIELYIYSISVKFTKIVMKLKPPDRPQASKLSSFARLPSSQTCKETSPEHITSQRDTYRHSRSSRDRYTGLLHRTRHALHRLRESGRHLRQNVRGDVRQKLPGGRSTSAGSNSQGIMSATRSSILIKVLYV